MRKRVQINQLTPSKIQQWAEDGVEFQAASMGGRVGYFDVGRLDKGWAQLYRDDGPKISYTVVSYATPIAWRTPDGWAIVTQRFSPTTDNRHQPAVRGLRPQRTVEPRKASS